VGCVIEMRRNISPASLFKLQNTRRYVSPHPSPILSLANAMINPVIDVQSSVLTGYLDRASSELWLTMKYVVVGDAFLH